MTTSNLFSLEVVQKSQHCQLRVLRENSTVGVIHVGGVGPYLSRCMLLARFDCFMPKKIPQACIHLNVRTQCGIPTSKCEKSM